MPRKSRKLSKSQVYHIMLRGNERKNLFSDNEDRLKFLYILVSKKENGEFAVYSYCLMDNHVHLVIKECKDNLSRIMKRVNTSYAYYYNKKYNRVGHVFQDRYRSEIIEDETYLLNVIKYIHNNPVQAKMVKDIFEFPWSSYRIYLGDEEGSRFSEMLEILELYSSIHEKAIELFVEHTNANVKDNNYLDIQEPDMDGEQNETIKKYIGTYLKNKNITSINDILQSRVDRNMLMRELKNSGIPIRKIAETLGVDRNIVQRAK